MGNYFGFCLSILFLFVNCLMVDVEWVLVRSLVRYVLASMVVGGWDDIVFVMGVFKAIKVISSFAIIIVFIALGLLMAI